MESSRKSYSGRCPWADRPAHLWDSSPLARLWGQWQREQCGEVLVQPPEGVGAEGLPAFPHLQGLIEASALPEEGHFQCQQLLYAELGEHKMEVAQHKAVFADSGVRASGHGATCTASTSVLPAWGRDRVTVSAVAWSLGLDNSSRKNTSAFSDWDFLF